MNLDIPLQRLNKGSKIVLNAEASAPASKLTKQVHL